MVKRINNDGFTLIELLVVISIIALLTGILVPCIGKAKAIAKRTVCRSPLHSAAIVFRMYLDDNDHVMPPAPRLPSVSDKPLIAEFLKPFIKNPETLACPADDGHRRPGRTERYFDTEGSSYEYLDPLGWRARCSRLLNGQGRFQRRKSASKRHTSSL